MSSLCPYKEIRKSGSVQKSAGITGLRLLSLERSASWIGHWLKPGDRESGVSPPSFGKSGFLGPNCLCEHWFMLRISSLLECWHSGYELIDQSPLKISGRRVSLMSFPGRQHFTHAVTSYCERMRSTHETPLQ